LEEAAAEHRNVVVMYMLRCSKVVKAAMEFNMT
jgi:hypothetical protein